MSNTDIYNRLHSASSYHPASVELFDDFAVEAGDVITVVKGSNSYTLPIFRKELNWTGTSVVTLESSGNRERAGLPALERREYANESQQYQYQQNMVTRVNTLVANAIQTLNLNAITARIQTIEADYLTASDIAAERAYVNNFFAGNAPITTAVITNANVTNFKVLVNENNDSDYKRFDPYPVVAGQVTLGSSRKILVEQGTSLTGSLDLQHYHTITAAESSSSPGQINITLGAVASSEQTANFNIADTQFYANRLSAIQTSLSVTPTLRSISNDNNDDEYRGYLTLTISGSDGLGNSISKTDQSHYISLQDFYDDVHGGGSSASWYVGSSSWTWGNPIQDSQDESHWTISGVISATATNGTDTIDCAPVIGSKDISSVYTSGYVTGYSKWRSDVTLGGGLSYVSLDPVIYKDDSFSPVYDSSGHITGWDNSESTATACQGQADVNIWAYVPYNATIPRSGLNAGRWYDIDDLEVDILSLYERIYKDAYNEGLDAGVLATSSTAYDSGYADGHSAGYAEGLAQNPNAVTITASDIVTGLSNDGNTALGSTYYSTYHHYDIKSEARASSNGVVVDTAIGTLHLIPQGAYQAALDECTASLSGNTLTLTMSYPVYNTSHSSTSTTTTLTATKTVTGGGGSGGSSSNPPNDVGVSLGRLNRSDYGSSSISGNTYSNPSGKYWETSAVVEVYDSSMNTLLTKTKTAQISTANLNANHIIHSVNVLEVNMKKDRNGDYTIAEVVISFNGTSRTGTPNSVNFIV